jgi:hypothetical protein
MSYTMIDNGRAIRCDDCGSASYNTNDIRHKYCGRCHKYHTGQITLSRDELIQRGYAAEPYYPPYRYAGPELSDAAPAADVCRAEPDARPSSSDIDYGSSSSSSCGSSSSDSSSSSSDSGGGWGGD